MTRDLKLLIRVQAEIRDAINALQRVNNLMEMLSGMSGNTSRTVMSSFSRMSQKVDSTTGQMASAVHGHSQRSRLDIMMWTMGFEELGMVATRAFRRMTDASPSLAAQLAILSFSFDNLALTLGEQLAPYIEIVVNAVIKLNEWISRMPAPIQEWIGVTIAISAVLASLVPIIVAVTLVGGALLLQILLIIAAIAAVVVITKYLIDHWDTLAPVMKRIFDLIIQNMPFISGLIDLFKKLVKVVKWAFEHMGDAWGWLKKMFGDAKEFLSGVIEGISNAIGGVVIGFLNLLIEGINWFIEKINSFFDKLRGWKLLPDFIKEAIPDLEPIPTFHSGGFVAGSGEVLALLQGGEYVLSRQQVAAIQSAPRFSNPVVNLTVNIDQPILRDETDIDELANRVSQKIREELERGASWP
jgi:hypothetical protein